MDEQKLYGFWEKEGLFKADPTSTKKPYSLLMPPPNLTGELHLGHAMQHSILDALARFKRMQGFDVLLQPGIDHAGIQFEGALNKILSKEDLTKNKLGRDAWMKRALKFKDEVYASFHKDWTVFGISADWSREVFTMDEKRSQAVYEEFKKYYDDGLVYKGAYIVQWCPKCGTAIEDVEMEYEERKEKLYFVRYVIPAQAGIHGSRVKPGMTDDYIVIATARPETIYADTGIAIYPNHPKFKQFAGSFAINPLNGNKIPIFEDKRVDKDFGTGALKITPGHDPLDFAIGTDNKLPILHAIDKTGKMTDLAGDLVGLKIEEARKLTTEKLEKLGAIKKVEEYTHSVPVCERCKTTIEPLISEEWFVSMQPLAKNALARIKDVTFVPKNYQKILSDWIKEIHDWCISRPLWWGYRIPVWYCEGCNAKHEAKKDKGLIISNEKPKECPKCMSRILVQDENLLDTWFSSGLWPMATLGWPDQTEEFKKYFPWSFEISAGEIKYLWIARMIMLSLHFTDQIPFENMFFHGMIRDLQGRKFSKSLGNGIDPNELRAQWGTDATRMALYTYAAPGRDGRANRQTIDERAKNFRNFGTKLTNISRFIIDLKPAEIATSPSASRNDVIASEAKQSTNTDDKQILEKLDKTILEVTKNLENFNLHLATDTLYEFIWHEFADKYIESTKERRAEAQPTLEYVFKTSLELLHPFMPFITEELWQRLPHTGKSIMLANWPAKNI
ncbi:MAG: valine--tRNA ligase [Candidatus Daviesbacteria bacterium]|nr:valine--tRNA ligase [Candidatus Daviesbacteria bacterium]